MIKVLKSGLMTTIQDLGRYGLQKYGIITSGAMDKISLRLANLLVGNPENAAAIEMILLGSSFLFQSDCLIAVTGADFSPTIDNRPLPMWQPVLVKKGALLNFKAAKTGCCSYLAISGSFQLPKIMNSRSTYLRAHIGGLEGRALRENDTLALHKVNKTAETIIKQIKDKASENGFKPLNWSLSKEFRLKSREKKVLRFLKGNEYHLFTKESQAQFSSVSFRVTPQSDRMGYRLKGAALKTLPDCEMISEAVTCGTVQIPPDGNPILLLADHQTAGGYPRIAQIISADLSSAAQTKPGEKIEFREITLEEAQRLLIEQEKKIDRLKKSIITKWRYI